MARTASPIQVVVQDPVTGRIAQQFVLTDTEAEGIVGRSRDCLVLVKERSVSRKHAALVLHDGALEIRDLRSTNGTRVNGEPVSSELTHLQSGSVVFVGEAALLISYHEIINGDQTVVHAVGVIGVLNALTDDEQSSEPDSRLAEGTFPRNLPAIEAEYYRERDEAEGDFAGATAIMKRPPSELEANSVGLATPGGDAVQSPPGKGREAMSNHETLRDRVRAGLSDLSLDSTAMRAFYSAYVFRREIRTTGEGEPDVPELRRLARALARAFTRDWVDPNRTQLETAESVPPAFRQEVAAAVVLVQLDYLRALGRTLVRQGGASSLITVLEGALLAYSNESRNGLNAEPW